MKTMTVTDELESNVNMKALEISDIKNAMDNQDITGCSKATLDHKQDNHDVINEKKLVSQIQQPSVIVDNEFKYDINQSDSAKRKSGNIEDEEPIIEHIPPDGGIRAWMIMVGSFTINGILFSVINSYSLIFLELAKTLKEVGESEVNAKAALVGSLTIGTTFFLSPIAGILTDKIGIQITTFIGGALAFGGLLLSSIFSHKVELLYLTYGIMYGLGASLAYTPSLVILGHYFKRRLGLVNGIVTAGSSVFTVIMPYLMGALLKHFGLEGTLRSLAILTSVVMMCAILFKPLPVNNKVARTLNYDNSQRNDVVHKLKVLINLSIWKKKRYVVWASAIPIALFGYFVPYVHIGNFVVNVFGPDANKTLPVMCIGITSGIGRLVFGFIADLPRVNRIFLQQISFVSIGILTMLLPLTPHYYASLLLITLFMGLFDGCFISLLGPIAFDICGRNGATQAIGCLLGMCSIPLTVGPPIAGLIYEHTGSYTIPFILAGVPPVIGAIAMFLVRCVKDESETDSPNELTNESKNNDDCIDGLTRTRLNFTLKEREESRSRREKTQASALCITNQQKRVCYFHPHSHDHRKEFNYHAYSESVPLLFSQNKNGN